MRHARSRPVPGRQAALGLALAASLVATLAAPCGISPARGADPLIAGPAAATATTAPAATPSQASASSVVPARATTPRATQAAAAAPGVRPRIIRHGPRTDRVIALTFDDGYSPATLRRIYRILVRENVPATFFVNGMYIRRAPDLWRRIAERFPLANHSYRHRNMRRLAAAEVVADLVRTRKAVERATGRPMLPYYRPPYGSRNRATDRLAAQAGFPYVVLWDVTGADTLPHPTAGSVVRSATTGRRGSILLLHAGPRVTARALPRIIARYRDRGFRFVSLQELIGLPPAPSSVSREAEAALRAGDALPAARPGARTVDTPDGASAGVPPEAPAVVTAAVGASPRPRARDAAWARRDSTLPWIAGWTVAGLLLLLLVAAAAGRGQRREEDPSA